MANYSNLKNIIDQVVKTNGQGDITGENLNQTLIQMVTELGSYYHYAGVAVPSTNPGSPDQNLFYIATIAGTYNYFNGIVVPKGITVLKYDGTWLATTLYTVDTGLTPNSTALVQSGVVFDQFKKDGGAYDISAHFPNAGVEDGNTYTLDAAVRLIPVDLQTGGMSIKFIDSVSFEYVTYYLPASIFTINPDAWVNINTELATKITAERIARIAADEHLNDLINAIQPIVVEGNVVNAPDEIDLTSVNHGGTNVLQLKDRNNLNGMGYIILRRDKSFASQLTQTNTIYEIRYDFDLNDPNGESPVTIPAGCVLQFTGGSLRNGTIISSDNQTRINDVDYNIFNNCIVKGFNLPYLDVRWFGAIPDGVFIDGTIVSGTDNAEYFQRAFDCHEFYKRSYIRIIGTYLINHTVYAHSTLNMVGCVYPTSRYITGEGNYVSRSAILVGRGIVDDGSYNNNTFAFVSDGLSYTASQRIKVATIHIENLCIYGDADNRVGNFLKCTATGLPGSPNRIVNCEMAYLNIPLYIEPQNYSEVGTILGNLNFSSCTIYQSNKAIIINATPVTEPRADKRSSNLILENTSFSCSGTYALKLENVYGSVRIEHCTFLKPIYLSAMDLDTNISISDCYFEGATTEQVPYTIVAEFIPIYGNEVYTKPRISIFNNAYLWAVNISGFCVDTLDIAKISNSKFSNCFISKKINVANFKASWLEGINMFEDYPTTENIPNNAFIKKLGGATEPQKYYNSSQETLFSLSNQTAYGWIYSNDILDNFCLLLIRVKVRSEDAKTITCGLLDNDGAGAYNRINGKYFDYTIVLKKKAGNSGISPDAPQQRCYVSLNIPTEFLFSQATLYILNSDDILSEFPRVIDILQIGNSYPQEPLTGDIFYNISKGMMTYYKSDKWLNMLNHTPGLLKGTTGDRNSLSLNNTNDVGYVFFDTLLNRSVSWNGSKWVEEDGASAGVKRNGTTANRPLGSSIYVGFIYFDTDISPARPIYAAAINGDTVTWVDATGATI